jgi:hypothetical protein
MLSIGRLAMNRKLLLSTALGTVLALWGGGAFGQASRTWVSGVGDDANPCSRTAPCKTFAGAISKTADGGEINCLDPGGFGAVTITKAITLDCTGTHGSVLVAGTNGIVVNAISTGTNKVVIRGLSINGVGTGLDGIKFVAGAQLSVEQCFITEFKNGVELSSAASLDVYITNTYITNVTQGVLVNNTSGIATVSMTNVWILNAGGAAFEAQNGVVATITNSTISSATMGVLVSGGSQVNVDTSYFLDNNVATNASVAGAFIRVANNGMYNNGANFVFAAGATIASAGNNRITAGGVGPNGTLTLQ